MPGFHRPVQGLSSGRGFRFSPTPTHTDLEALASQRGLLAFRPALIRT